MKHHMAQRGSMHIIVIAVLIIALFATLGVVFYQNFIAKKEETVKIVPSPTTADTFKTERVAFNSSIYALDYPKEWSLKTETASGSSMGGTLTRLTSPDQKVEVDFTVAETAVNNSCDVNDGLKVSYYKVYPTAVTKLTDESLYVVESLYDNAGGGYLYAIGLTPEGGDTHAAIGDSHCNVSQVGQASSALYTNNALVHPTIKAAVAFPKLTKDAAPIKEMQPAKDLIATDSYKAAVKILESARKE